ncbi:F-box protein: endocytic membrane traffic, recycling ReCYcling 1 [Coemansia biformis]|uniref:F-box protein: endocytic membrane traffic, recycling ReCYcling 1 n=1 Tax=Coemansia biformis TaxID=1286918 RepID=A0A9W7Y6D2_9FUNG|nr:F-box protein: endocytic membrane traffic, recycling ReCYcling 1 [Coemansia biformis]
MANPGGYRPSATWLSVPNPRGLLDRTAKFVLNATHGSRTLLPTSDLAAAPGDTQVGGLEDAAAAAAWWDDRDGLMGRRPGRRRAAAGGDDGDDDDGETWERHRVERIVPECDVLQGMWNEWSVVAVGEVKDTVRVERFLNADAPPGRRPRVGFIGLPARVIVRVLGYLAVGELVAVVNSCRVVRRIVHRREPGVGGVGGEAYTPLGLQLWRTLLARMGWRIFEERIPGKEPRLRVKAPPSSAELLRRISDVEDEEELAALVAADPDLVFKALYDDLSHDFCAMRTAVCAMPPVVTSGDTCLVAERLDQLLWFGRARLCRNSDAANRRLVAAADHFEHLYSRRFAAALASGDTDAMRAAAQVLARLCEGRGCIATLAEAHPLFRGDSIDERCVRLLKEAEDARDADTFAEFLGGLQRLVVEHTRVVELALPPGWMRASAVFCFVDRVFAVGGVGRTAVQRACGQAQGGDEAYLSTVAGVAGQLLAAVDEWTRLAAVPQTHGRRCVFAALAGVVAEYAEREQRAIESRYGAEVEQWAVKEGAALHTAPEQREPRRVNFELQYQQMEEYKARVLSVLDAKLGTGAAGDARRTVVGDLMMAPVGIDLCLNMLLANRDAVARLAVFATAPPDVRLRALARDAIESVFCALLKSTGNHIRPAFARTVAELKELEHAADEWQRMAPSGDSAQRFAGVWQRFFEVVQLSDLVVQLVEVYHKRELTGFIDEHDFLNAANQERKAFERSIDDSVAVGMDSVIEVILRQTQHILESNQQAADYHPDTSTSLMLHPTIACTSAVQFLGECSAALRSMSTHRQVRDVVMAEIAHRLFAVLLEHIKTFRITEPGGFQLIADLNLYYDWASSNVDPEALRFFAALKDLANCFILAPRDLRAFLHNHYSRRTFDGVMRSEEVYDVVACRADYREIRTQVEGHCEFM